MFLVEREAFALFMLRSFLFGALTAAVYLSGGLLRIPLGRMKKIPRILLLLPLDGAFCLAAAFFALLLIYSANRGQMRIAAMLFFAVGYLLVYLPLARLVYRAEGALLSAIGRKILFPARRKMKTTCAKLRASADKRKKERKEKEFDRSFDRLLLRAVRKSLDEGYAALFGSGETTKRKDDRNERRKPFAAAHRRGALHRAVHRDDH